MSATYNRTRTSSTLEFAPPLINSTEAAMQKPFWRFPVEFDPNQIADCSALSLDFAADKFELAQLGCKSHSGGPPVELD